MPYCALIASLGAIVGRLYPDYVVSSTRRPQAPLETDMIRDLYSKPSTGCSQVQLLGTPPLAVDWPRKRSCGPPHSQHAGLFNSQCEPRSGRQQEVGEAAGSAAAAASPATAATVLGSNVECLGINARTAHWVVLGTPTPPASHRPCQDHCFFKILFGRVHVAGARWPVGDPARRCAAAHSRPGGSWPSKTPWLAPQPHNHSNLLRVWTQLETRRR